MRMTESRLRSIIRSIILESAGQVDRLPEKIEGMYVKKLIGNVNYIFDLVDYDDPEDREEFVEDLAKGFEGYLQHVEESYLDKIIEGIKNFEDERTGKYLSSSSGEGTYMIRPEAFRILGLSNKDITRLREYKSNEVYISDSPDAHDDLIYFTITSLI